MGCKVTRGVLVFGAVCISKWFSNYPLSYERMSYVMADALDDSSEDSTVFDLRLAAGNGVGS